MLNTAIDTPTPNKELTQLWVPCKHTHTQTACTCLHTSLLCKDTYLPSFVSEPTIVFPSLLVSRANRVFNAADMWSHEQNLNRVYVQSRQTEAGAHSSVTRMNGHH